MTQGFTIDGDGFIRMRAALAGVRMRFPQNATLNVGWDNRAKYPDGTYVADVARWQEFGTKRIPPRPFIRVAIAENGDEWVNLVWRGMRDSSLPIDAILERVGLVMAADIQKAIRGVTQPSLAPSTIKGRLRKGVSKLALDTGTYAKPLVDTGTMLRTVRSEVVMGASATEAAA